MREMIWRLIARAVSQPRIAAALIKRAKRTPYSHITSSDGTDVYMYRYWLFNAYSEDVGKKEGQGSEKDDRRWAWLPSIRVHHICRPDSDRDLHDHPWNARTCVLIGGYSEEVPAVAGQYVAPDVTIHRDKKAGDTGRLLFGQYHRINSVSTGGVWTLFFTWKYCGTWGFMVDGKKVPWRQYLGKEPSPPSFEADAVVKAAREWLSERSVKDWAEADLAKAVVTLEGDWPGCPDCDHECDEPCMPATVKEYHGLIDCQVAQLVHDGVLSAYEGYEPPQGWVPARKRRTISVFPVARSDASAHPSV